MKEADFVCRIDRLPLTLVVVGVRDGRHVIGLLSVEVCLLAWNTTEPLDNTNVTFNMIDR